MLITISSIKMMITFQVVTSGVGSAAVAKPSASRTLWGWRKMSMSSAPASAPVASLNFHGRTMIRKYVSKKTSISPIMSYQALNGVRKTLIFW